MYIRYFKKFKNKFQYFHLENLSIIYEFFEILHNFKMKYGVNRMHTKLFSQ